MLLVQQTCLQGAAGSSGVSPGNQPFVPRVSCRHRLHKLAALFCKVFWGRIHCCLPLAEVLCLGWYLYAVYIHTLVCIGTSTNENMDLYVYVYRDKRKISDVGLIIRN